MDQLVSGLYAQFVLRDFLGRIVPGAIFLLLVALGFATAKDLHQFASGMPFAYWAVAGGMAWTTATGLQLVTEAIYGLLYHRRKDFRSIVGRPAAAAPASPPDDQPPQSLVESELWKRARRLNLWVEFSRHATELERMRRERFVVVRHACSTTCLALVAGAVVCLLVAVSTGSGNARRILSYWPHLWWAVPLAASLAVAGHSEYRSQRSFEETVLRQPPALPAGQQRRLRT